MVIICKGDSYDGGWVNNKKEGFGKYTWANGNVFQGLYVDGVRKESGSLQFANGCIFEGSFDSQKMTVGTLYLENKKYNATFSGGDLSENKHRVYETVLEEIYENENNNNNNCEFLQKGTFSNGVFYPDTETSLLLLLKIEAEQKRAEEDRIKQEILDLETKRANEEAAEQRAEEEKIRIILEDEERRNAELQAEIQREIDACKAEENRFRFQQEDKIRRAADEVRRRENEENLRRAIEAASTPSPSVVNSIVVGNSDGFLAHAVSISSSGCSPEPTVPLLSRPAEKQRVVYDYGVYEGQIGEDGSRCGSGVLRSTVGEFAGCEYDGMRRDNQREGYGQYKWRNGSIYIGQWSNDLFSGYGKLVWMAGEVYEGYFVKGNRDGQGRLIWKSGNTFEGIFEKDLLKNGIFTISDCQFNAVFEPFEENISGNRVYTALLVDANGFVQTGSFVSGSFTPDIETRKRIALSTHS